MMKNKSVIWAFAFALFLSSCSTFPVSVAGKYPSPGHEPTYSKWSHFFFFGLGPDDEINAAKVCGGARNVIMVERVSHAGHALLAFFPGLFGIIWNPFTSNVYCKLGAK